MKLTDVLSAEHRVIAQVAAALAAAADRVQLGIAMRPGFFADAARFIVEFADGSHHAKEERVLFASMAKHGMAARSGPIAVMLREHEEARRLAAGMRTAAARLANGDAAAGDLVAGYARAWGALLTQHISKEDNILFPLASLVIPASERDALLREAARLGRDETPYLELARLLCRDAGVDPGAVHSPAPSDVTQGAI